MTQKKKNRFDFESDEKRQKYLKEIIGFFQDERGEDIGILAAGKVLDFFLATMGEEIYKKAIKDAKELLHERMEDMEVDMEMLSGE